jgi:PST family polysaccharide transporter
VRWNYLGSLANAACALVIGAVLARILGPKPFGRVIIAITVYGFVNLFTDGGFTLALVQKKDLSDFDIRRTFTFQSLIGFGLSIVVVFLAPGIATFFHDPGAAPVVRIMSLLIAIQGLGLTSSALLKREMRFKTIQQCSLAGYLVGYLLIGIPLAYCGCGVWSLVAAYMTQGVTLYGLMYLSVRHPLTPSFGLPPRAISSFGRKAIFANFAGWGHVNLDNLAASNRQGSFALGLYGRVCSFAFTPCGVVVNSLQSVLLSSSAKAQERQKVVGEMALVAIAVILAIIGPAYATFAMIPGTVITGIYGSKWILAIPLATPLAIAVVFYSCMCMMGPVLSGLGKPEREMWPQIITCAIAAVAYFIAAKFSLLALAWTVCACNALRLLLLLISTFSLLCVSWLKIAATFLRGLLFSGAFGASMWLLDHNLQVVLPKPEVRLLLVFVFSVAALGALLWYCTTWLLGARTIAFFHRYSSTLPAFLRQHLNAIHVGNGGSMPGEDGRPVAVQE